MRKRQNWQENIPMTKDKFWEVIDNARAIAPALEGEPLRESLYKQLLKLSPDELVGFDCAWQEYRRIANSPQLIAAACMDNIILHRIGCSICLTLYASAYSLGVFP